MVKPNRPLYLESKEKQETVQKYWIFAMSYLQIYRKNRKNNNPILWVKDNYDFSTYTLCIDNFVMK